MIGIPQLATLETIGRATNLPVRRVEDGERQNAALAFFCPRRIYSVVTRSMDCIEPIFVLSDTDAERLGWRSLRALNCHLDGSSNATARESRYIAPAA